MERTKIPPISIIGLLTLAIIFGGFRSEGSGMDTVFSSLISGSLSVCLLPRLV